MSGRAGRAPSGAEIRSLRLSRGLTQRRLAEILGVARHRVILWESGRRAPDGEAARVLRALPVPEKPAQKSAPRRTAALHHISRYLTLGKRARGKGWLVVVVRGRKRHSRSFPDAVWGGEKKALLAAKRSRDELLLELGPDLRIRQKPPRGVVSKTGVVGVTLEEHRVEGRRYLRYVATWPRAGGRPVRKRFLVSRWGKKEALRRAIEARKDAIEKLREVASLEQRAGAAARLERAPSPKPVRDPFCRRGINAGIPRSGSRS